MALAIRVTPTQCHGMLRSPMPWSFKTTIAMFVGAGLGALLITFACLESGWASITHFAWGLGITGIGLVGALLFSIVCAVTEPIWRKRSILLLAVAIFLLIGLIAFARVA